MALPAPALNPVERRLLELAAEGRSLVAAGRELALDTRAVTATISALRTRFGVGSTAAAVDAARGAGLLWPRQTRPQRVSR